MFYAKEARGRKSMKEIEPESVDMRLFQIDESNWMIYCYYAYLTVVCLSLTDSKLSVSPESHHSYVLLR